MSDAATKSDLKMIDTKIDKLGSKLEGRIDSLTEEMRTGFDELTDILRQFMNQTSDEFAKVHAEIADIKKDIQRVYAHIDKIEKQLEIDSDERKVLGYEIQRIHDWAVQAGKRLGFEFKTH